MVKGFQFPGDRADYAVEVHTVHGLVCDPEGFDQSAEISLLLGETSVPVKTRSADTIVFGPVRLPEGRSPFSLAVGDDAKPGTAIAEVLEISLRLEPNCL